MASLVTASNTLTLQGNDANGNSIIMVINGYNGTGTYNFDGNSIPLNIASYLEIDINNPTNVETWTASVKNATQISSSDETNEVYAFRTKGGNTVVYKIDANSGNLLWADGNELKGNLVRYEFTKAGLALVTSIDNSGKKGLGKLASARSQCMSLMSLKVFYIMIKETPYLRTILKSKILLLRFNDWE